MKVALVFFGFLFVAACSHKTMSRFFDIPEKPAAEPAAAQDPEVVNRSAVGPGGGAIPGAGAASEEPRPEIEETLVWEEALALLPKDATGQPDWSAALRNGVIKPRARNPGDAGAAAFQMDFFFKGANPMFDAYFPHSAHVSWMGCNSCHPAVFKYRHNDITMAGINQGKFCGACHGKVAFAATTCKRCHTSMP